MSEKLVQLAIKVRDDGSVEVLDRVEGKLDDVADGAQQGTRAMASGFAALKGSLLEVWAAVELGEKAVRVVAGVAAGFVEAASTAEQYKVRLQVLLKSQGEANRLFDEMNRYAAQTPFEFEEIMGAATALSGVVKGGVGEVTRLMPLIGDLAAASGLSIQEATGQVIRMWSAGAASADLFRERGILAMLGFQAGVTYSAQETREQLMAEWQKTDSSFRGATDQLADTWGGLTSMLADKWFAFRTRLMDAGVFELLKEQTRSWNDQLEAMMAPGGVLDRLVKWVGELPRAALTLEREGLTAQLAGMKGGGTSVFDWSLFGGKFANMGATPEEIAEVERQLAVVNEKLVRLDLAAANRLPPDPWMPKPAAPARGDDLPALDSTAAEWQKKALHTALPTEAGSAYSARLTLAVEALGRFREALPDDAVRDYSDSLAEAVQAQGRFHSALTTETGSAYSERLTLAVEGLGRFREALPGDEVSAYSQDLEAAVESLGRFHSALPGERATVAMVTWADGAKQALRDYAIEAGTLLPQVASAVSGAFLGLEDALVQSFTRGRLAFRDFADAVIADLARIFVRQQITGPLAQAVGGWFGGPVQAGPAMAMGGAVAHTGGVPGVDSLPSRQVPIELFRRAPRFHGGGLAGDELPAVLRRGEGVFTPGQMRALAPAAPIEVRVVNQTATPVEPEVRRSTGADGRQVVELVLREVARDVARGGPTAQAIGQTFGLSRVGRST